MSSFAASSTSLALILRPFFCLSFFPICLSSSISYSTLNQQINSSDSPILELSFSTYLGGNNLDQGFTIDIAEDGSCYVAGFTNSSDFPTLNAFDNSFSGTNDFIVAKFSANGSLLWSTYLGGDNKEYLWFKPGGIAVADDGSCYVTGSTNSSDFPILNSYNDTFGGEFDAFITKFSSTGSLIWSTFLGGSSEDCGPWGTCQRPCGGTAPPGRPSWSCTEPCRDRSWQSGPAASWRRRRSCSGTSCSA